MNHDVFNWDKNLSTVLYNIDNSDISDKNKEAIKKFYESCVIEGISKGRTLRYVHTVKLIAERWFEKDFEDATEEDIKELIRKIEEAKINNAKNKGRGYSEWSKYHFKITIKKFFQQLRGYEWGSKVYPEEVEWIKIKMKSNGNHKLPQELLSEKEIKKMIECGKNPMEEAFVAVLYESACRIGEMLNLQIKHLDFGFTHGVKLTFDGKTGMRKIPLILSEPYLTKWINEHPFKDDPESFLWLNRNKEPLKYTSAMNLLKKLKKKAGIKKRVHAHLLRHSRLTQLAKSFTEFQMRQFAGWVKNSEMAGIYVHLAGRDLDSAYCKIYGKTVEEEKENGELEPIVCPKCDFDKNPATGSVCGRCATPLSENFRRQIIDREMKMKTSSEIIDKMLEDEEFKEMFLEKVKSVIH